MSFRMSCEFPLTTTEHLKTKKKGNGNIKTTTTRFHVFVCDQIRKRWGQRKNGKLYYIVWDKCYKSGMKRKKNFIVGGAKWADVQNYDKEKSILETHGTRTKRK